MVAKLTKLREQDPPRLAHGMGVILAEAELEDVREQVSLGSICGGFCV